jgi:hypothetical protein
MLVAASALTVHLFPHQLAWIVIALGSLQASPNTVLWIPVEDVAAYNAELLAKEHGYSRPGIEDDGPGGPTMTVIDPSGNHSRFAQPS